MDEMDRMLAALGQDPVPQELVAAVRLEVRRRHRRQLVIRRAAASLLAVVGAWLLWPGLVWVSSNELYSSSAPWLISSLDSLNAESMDLLGRLWNGALSMQGAIGSGLAVSILLGAALLCCSIFLGIDRASWLPNAGQRSMPPTRSISASGVHL